jgi:hypothetical protein
MSERDAIPSCIEFRNDHLARASRRPAPTRNRVSVIIGVRQSKDQSYRWRDSIRAYYLLPMQLCPSIVKADPHCSNFLHEFESVEFMGCGINPTLV